MIDTRLILVTGISGSGKSTTTRSLARQLHLNGIRCHWLHEEIRRHPIRDGEFTLGPLETEADYQRNIQDMYRRWGRMLGRILRSKSVYIMEGVLTDNIIRYFFEGDYPPEKIMEYYDGLFQLLAPVRPALVQLYRPNVRATLEGIYPLRGQWWKDLILSGINNKRYMLNRGLSGDAGVYAMWEDYQALSNVCIRRYNGPKITMDTSDGTWEQITKKITYFLGLDFLPPVVLTIDNPEQYCGRYTVEVEGKIHSIEVCFDGFRLFVKSWWPVMPLETLGQNRFEFISFPIRLTFQRDATGRVDSLDATGTYDWEIVGTHMQRIMAD